MQCLYACKPHETGELNAVFSSLLSISPPSNQPHQLRIDKIKTPRAHNPAHSLARFTSVPRSFSLFLANSQPTIQAHEIIEQICLIAPFMLFRLVSFRALHFVYTDDNDNNKLFQHETLCGKEKHKISFNAGNGMIDEREDFRIKKIINMK